MAAASPNEMKVSITEVAMTTCVVWPPRTSVSPDISLSPGFERQISAVQCLWVPSCCSPNRLNMSRRSLNPFTVTTTVMNANETPDTTRKIVQNSLQPSIAPPRESLSDLRLPLEAVKKLSYPSPALRDRRRLGHLSQLGGERRCLALHFRERDRGVVKNSPGQGTRSATRLQGSLETLYAACPHAAF